MLVLGSGWVLEDDGSIRSEVISWDVTTGERRFRIALNALSPAIAFSPDGAEFCLGFNRLRKDPGPTLAFYSTAGVKLGELETFPDIDPQNPRIAFVNTLAYSRDGTKVGGVNWAADGIFLADRADMKLLWVNPMPAPITSVAFSADSRRVVSTGYDDIVRFYDIETGNEVANLNGSIGRVDDYAFPGQIRFSPDGRSLASTHWNGHMSIWHVDQLTDDPIDPTRHRSLADNAAFRFHLYSATVAMRANDAFAYRIQAERLRSIPAPTPALASDWQRLSAAVAPKQIAPAIFGGVAGDWATDAMIP
jgi:WD40 repeat protein